jgi:hypothetical protein
MDAAIASLGGQALHAHRLVFLHPFAHGCIQIEAPLPDIVDLLLTLLSYEVIF